MAAFGKRQGARGKGQGARGKGLGPLAAHMSEALALDDDRVGPEGPEGQEGALAAERGLGPGADSGDESEDADNDGDDEGVPDNKSVASDSTCTTAGLRVEMSGLELTALRVDATPRRGRRWRVRTRKTSSLVSFLGATIQRCSLMVLRSLRDPQGDAARSVETCTEPLPSMCAMAPYASTG